MIDQAFRFWRLHGTRASVNRARDVVGEKPLQMVYEYWRHHGTATTARQLASVLGKAIPGPGGDLAGLAETSEQLLQRQLVALRRLPVRRITRSRPRLNLLTDSINPPHLYGGVGTGLIFATLLAERVGCDLRIITRNDRANEKNYASIIELAKLKMPSRVDYAFVSYAVKPPSLEVGPDEHFITTSWWTSRAVRQSVDPRRIIYLLQEDERMFYPGGDDHLRCSELLADPDLTFVVNTQLLHEHLVQSGFSNLVKNGVWFEPSFPDSVFYAPPQTEPRSRYRFLYYARPKNLRNLFYRGLEAIQAAVDAKILTPSEWELYFVGKDIPCLALAKDFSPRRFENLPWHSYAELVRQMDLGLSLMYTPHPSYPPLDLAASGAAVVTNHFGPYKHSLDQYSKNIICAEPSVQGLLRGIEQGVALAKDTPRRRENFLQNRLLRDWRSSFHSAIEVCARRFS